ncbi:hypothetical protein GUJ93_ZPchr0013g37914 [Zizania palustris]|uniref:Uncharacterized protein n=1 Tax=Zizania palustris TaxID=103762 RepID=A0A8J5WZ47_ZIZPA|nr:hypothetical protein GUJ93_ZPchr0013g37914 [Zizania palustris]
MVALKLQSVCRLEKKMAFIPGRRVSLGGGVCAPKKRAIEAGAMACVVGDKEEDGGCVRACGESVASTVDAKVARCDVVRAASMEAVKAQHDSVEALHGDTEATTARRDGRGEGA